MKTTGMVRRVDSLGRIVIPKEIRKVLKIKENEQVEINVLDDSIVLNRYSELDEYDVSLTNLIDIIKESNEFKRLADCTNVSLNSLNDDINKAYIIKTIIKNGDTVGLLILLSDEKIEENDNKIFNLMNSFLDKYLE